MPGARPLGVRPGATTRRRTGPSTWAELDVAGGEGPVVLRVRPASLLEVSASLGRR